MIKIDFKNLQPPAISEETLEALQDNIEKAIDDAINYSYEEIDTGKKWVDGKSIYRKTFNISSIPTNVYNINLASLDIDKAFLDFNKSYFVCKNIAGFAVNRIVPLLVVNVITEGSGIASSNNQSDYYFNSDFSNLVLEVGSGLTVTGAVVTIEYTKKSG